MGHTSKNCRGRRRRSRSNSTDSEDERERRRKKAREATKKWDAPPGTVLPGAAQAVQFGAAGQYVDRRARRVYVGGLQPNVHEMHLRQFFDNCLSASPDRIHPPSLPPVMSVSLHRKPETNALFAFIEFATAEDADMGLCMDGVQFQGNALVIRRPKDFVPAVGREPRSYNIPVMGGSVTAGVSSKVDDGPDKLFVGSLPTSMTASEVQALLSSFGDLKSFNLVMTPQLQSRGFAFFRYRDPSRTLPAVQGLNGLEVMGNRLSCELCQCPKPSDATAMIDQLLSPQFLADPRLFASINSMNQPASILVAGAKPPTNVICLSNMVTPEELVAQQDYEEILEDVQQEMAGFGTVKSVHIPRPGTEGKGDVGKIYVEFETLENAWTASQALQGRKFNDRPVDTDRKSVV